MILGFAVVICVFVNLFTNPILSAFLPDRESMGAVAAAQRYLRFLSFFYLLIGYKAATDGILRGAGDAMYMVGNIVNLAVRVAFANCFAPILGIDAVWYGIPIGWGLNFVISFFRMKTDKWSRKKLI
jgi:Na+-driven multidrug efflux pump